MLWWFHEGKNAVVGTTARSRLLLKARSGLQPTLPFKVKSLANEVLTQMPKPVRYGRIRREGRGFCNLAVA